MVGSGHVPEVCGGVVCGVVVAEELHQPHGGSESGERLLVPGGIYCAKGPRT